MNEQNKPSGHISFLIDGRAEVNHTIYVASSDSVNEKYSSHNLVNDLRERTNEISNEVSEALAGATGYKFSVQISFHPGSVIIQGVISTLATTEIFQAAANFGGALALAQTIASVVSTVVGQHLPSWMSKPIIHASMMGNAPAQMNPIHTRPNCSGQDYELRAIKWAILGLLICAVLATGKYLFGNA